MQCLAIVSIDVHGFVLPQNYRKNGKGWKKFFESSPRNKAVKGISREDEEVVVKNETEIGMLLLLLDSNSLSS